MSAHPTPVVAWHGGDDPTTPLVVLLHGRGSDEREILGLADLLPQGPSYAAVRAPIPEGTGFAWFANQGIGRPVPESLAAGIAWFRAWLDEVAPHGRPVVLVGFSGGATFAGGVVLDDPDRTDGLATLFATLPFDAGVPTEPGRLAGVAVLVAQGDQDTVIPPGLQARSWAYLHEDSGAVVTAHRAPGGHGLTHDDLAVVSAWLSDRLASTVAH